LDSEGFVRRHYGKIGGRHKLGSRHLILARYHALRRGVARAGFNLLAICDRERDCFAEVDEIVCGGQRRRLAITRIPIALERGGDHGGVECERLLGIPVDCISTGCISTGVRPSILNHVVA